jgi:hypothetical protein
MNNKRKKKRQAWKKKIKMLSRNLAKRVYALLFYSHDTQI